MTWTCVRLFVARVGFAHVKCLGFSPDNVTLDCLTRNNLDLIQIGWDLTWTCLKYLDTFSYRQITWPGFITLGLTSMTFSFIAERFRLLNSVRWQKINTNRAECVLAALVVVVLFVSLGSLCPLVGGAICLQTANDLGGGRRYRCDASSSGEWWTLALWAVNSLTNPVMAAPPYSLRVCVCVLFTAIAESWVVPWH